jgi:hypothetical protein
MCTVLLPPGGYPIAVNKYKANTYLLRNYWCWKQENEMVMHDGTFYRTNMSNIINAFVYSPHPPQYHTILFLCHQLLFNLSHPQFHRAHDVCRTPRNPNPDVIPGWRPFPPEQTTDNPWHMQFITATLVQQAAMKQHPDPTTFSTESQSYEIQWFKSFTSKAQRLFNIAPTLRINTACIYVLCMDLG